MKIKDLLKLYKQELKSVYSSSEIEAVFFRLTEHFWQIDRLALSLSPGLEAKNHQLHKILPELKQHKPWQYITGNTEFSGLNFLVNPSVLIPRPETEELVQWMVDDYKNHSKKTTILDIGTGSGAIAVSLASKLPMTKITAYDISKPALEIAAQNAKLNNVNVDFQQVDILSLNRLSTKFDVIVSNPPYVQNSEKPFIRPNVLNYEPELALFVPDNNPLVFYQKIMELALQNNHQTSIYFEINEALKPELEQLLTRYKLTEYQFKKDFFDKWRMLKVCIK